MEQDNQQQKITEEVGERGVDCRNCAIEHCISRRDGCAVAMPSCFAPETAKAGQTGGAYSSNPPEGTSKWTWTTLRQLQGVRLEPSEADELVQMIKLRTKPASDSVMQQVQSEIENAEQSIKAKLGLEYSEQAPKRTRSILDKEHGQELVPDIRFWGDGDAWQLICKAYSDDEEWMKSTKAYEIPDLGCLVQVTTEQCGQVAESVVFVPGVRIETEIEERDVAKVGAVSVPIGRKLVPIVRQMMSASAILRQLQRRTLSPDEAEELVQMIKLRTNVLDSAVK